MLRLASTLLLISVSAVDRSSWKVSCVMFTVSALRNPQSDRKAIAFGCIMNEGFSEEREVFRDILLRTLSKIIETNVEKFANYARILLSTLLYMLWSADAFPLHWRFISWCQKSKEKSKKMLVIIKHACYEVLNHMAHLHMKYISRHTIELRCTLCYTLMHMQQNFKLQFHWRFTFY